MTTEDIKQLHAEWLTTFELPPDLDERARRILEPGQASLSQLNFLDEPAFGWRVATRLGLGHFTLSLLDRPCYQWVAGGVRLWSSLDNLNSAPRALIVQRAFELLLAPGLRHMYLNAALLACDASIDSVAQAFDLDTPVVEAYSDLFFNVIDRRDSPDYLRLAAKVGVIDLIGNPDQRTPLAAALGGVLDDVLHLARLDPGMWAA